MEEKINPAEAVVADNVKESTLATSPVQTDIGAARDTRYGTTQENKTAVNLDSKEADETGRVEEAVEQASVEKWNNPRINAVRFCAVSWSFLVIGMNDACIGALLPYIEEYYNINYTTVSTLFIVFFPGSLLAALLNNHIHHRFGQRGVALIGPIARVIGYIPMALHPRPFAILPCLLILTGFGNGIEDSAWNAWVGNLANANELLGLLHGAYGLGGTIAPLVATLMITKGGLPWWNYFYLMIALCGVQLVVLVSAFWTATGSAYRQRLNYEKSSTSVEGSEGAVENKKRVTTRQVLKGPIPWVIALFLFGYVGAEVSLGGWIVTFMLRVRHAEPFLAGLTVTLFWLGLTIGRVVLGFITGRIGEKLAITGYLLLSTILLILYWLVPHFIAAIVFVTLMGFFFGPLFPAAIVAVTKLLPIEHHISAVGFSAALGGGGAAVFPYAVGAIAQSHGVQVLQPFVLAILIWLGITWLVLPGGMRKGGLERAREEGTKPGGDLVRWWRKMVRRRN
ncbi:major facilitator superfamily protein [Sarocladium implicatum]|nr:major facilitator superfamily protein [Sarocladium implicatum]